MNFAYWFLCKIALTYGCPIYRMQGGLEPKKCIFVYLGNKGTAYFKKICTICIFPPSQHAVYFIMLSFLVHMNRRYMFYIENLLKFKCPTLFFNMYCFNFKYEHVF
jgi:hypothetical protein